jgi:Lrp/AsnC family transcriptional regulator, leucine-responsive regulatory protein
MFATSAQSFETFIRRTPGVVSASIVTGAFDFRLRVACKDQSDFVRLIEALRARGGVQETNSAVICREFEMAGASL